MCLLVSVAVMAAAVHIFLSLEEQALPVLSPFRALSFPPITSLLNILFLPRHLRSLEEKQLREILFGRRTVNIYPEWKEIHGS